MIFKMYITCTLFLAQQMLNKSVEARRRQRRNRRKRKRQQAKLEKCEQAFECDTDSNLPPFMDNPTQDDKISQMETYLQTLTESSSSLGVGDKNCLTFSEAFNTEASPLILQKRLDEERERRIKLHSHAGYCLYLAQSYKEKMENAHGLLKQAIHLVKTGITGSVKCG